MFFVPTLYINIDEAFVISLFILPKTVPAGAESTRGKIQHLPEFIPSLRHKQINYKIDRNEVSVFFNQTFKKEKIQLRYICTRIDTFFFLVCNIYVDVFLIKKLPGLF